MPRNVRQIINESRCLFQEADAVLIVCGAGMSVDSGITTYRGKNGLWTKEIQIGKDKFAYDEISSLKMWKERPDIAWGFKASFYNNMVNAEPHSGYFELLEALKGHTEYFVATSNIDGYFFRAGYDPDRIYEVHGSLNYLQCMSKKCNITNGISKINKDDVPTFDENTFIAESLPKCSHCGSMLRPNVSMFGDVEFYGKPYLHQRRRLNMWLENMKKQNKKLVILEIGCGINPHSLRMLDGKMMSGEWKLPVFDTNIGTIRINPEEDSNDNNDKKLHHIPMGAKKGIHVLLEGKQSVREEKS